MKHNIDFGKQGKHYHNCKQLEWFEGEWGDPSGWVCNARNYDTVEQENKHLNQLNTEDYRFKGKRCFESKAI